MEDGGTELLGMNVYPQVSFRRMMIWERKARGVR